MAGRGTRAAAPQLPAFFQRTTDLSDRHLDADGGPVVARLPAHRIGPEAGSSGLCQPDSRISICAAGWHRRRSQQPPACRDRDPGRLDAAGVCAGGADPEESNYRAGDFRARRSPGSGECIRYTRPAVFPGRHGGQGRLDECHRAQFLDVQRGARDWAGGGRSACREAGRRLVLFCQWRQLHRGHRRAVDDECARSGAGVGEDVAVGAHC